MDHSIKIPSVTLDVLLYLLHRLNSDQGCPTARSELGEDNSNSLDCALFRLSIYPARLIMAEDQPPAAPLEQAIEADSDPDFDDLDEVLDQFSANAASSQQPTSSSPPPKPDSIASGPGRPDDLAPPIHIPSGPGVNESEDDFMKRLTTEMSSVMGQMQLPNDSNATPEDLAKMGKQLEDFTYKMEKEGIKPEDLLKAILGEEKGTQLGDAANEERVRRESQPKSPGPSSSSKASFEDTIRKTVERMEDSSTKAASAVQEKSEEDMLADMLKALESGDSNEGDLSKMFLGMMEQLTSKELLYEPMLELHQKFPDWLSHNKGKIEAEDYNRYARQKEIVKDIVEKFEEKGYTDEDSKCREYVWEKMQKMQELGAPPEDLIRNPIPGLGGDGPPDDGCPTQ